MEETPRGFGRGARGRGGGGGTATVGGGGGGEGGGGGGGGEEARGGGGGEGGGGEGQGGGGGEEKRRGGGGREGQDGGGGGGGEGGGGGSGGARSTRGAFVVVGGEERRAVPRVQTSAEASKAEGEFAEALREARARITDYVAAPAAKKERRQINNHITVHVQQIAATRKQIEQKAADVAQFLHSLPNDPQRTYALVSLAKRILTQCDSQVSKLNRFAFALAEVAVRVAAFDRRFGVLLVALLHESCVLAVPKYYPFVEGRYASDEEYFKLMGYVKAEEQGDAPPETPKLENTDTFCLRLRGFMLFTRRTRRRITPGTRTVSRRRGRGYRGCSTRCRRTGSARRLWRRS